MSACERIAALDARGAPRSPVAGSWRSRRKSIETMHVQGNVYMLVGAGANVAVQIGDDGVLVVDSGAAARAKRSRGDPAAARTSPFAG